MKENNLSKYFLIVLIISASVACVLLFWPFLTEIVISAVLVSVFYSPFLKLSRFLGGKRKIAALLMCLMLLFIVIIPVSSLVFLTGKHAVLAYSDTVEFINDSSKNLKDSFLTHFDFIDLENEKIREKIFGVTKNLSNWLSQGATLFLEGATNFLISLVLILLTMFFFFIDGERLLDKLRFWTPLPNKYDKEIFKKFREVSRTSIISVFVASGAQGVVGAISFVIVGVPAFYPGLLIAFLALIPYFGAMLVYVPIGIYLILVGQILEGIFVLVWGMVVVGSTDNIVRAYLLKGKSKMNPIFIIFALVGGLTLFGFWGLVLGPLILSLVVTIFHIYELEYGSNLEKEL
jgi:predicted PurR-regulated permease PerM